MRLTPWRIRLLRVFGFDPNEVTVVIDLQARQDRAVVTLVSRRGFGNVTIVRRDEDAIVSFVQDIARRAGATRVTTAMDQWANTSLASKLQAAGFGHIDLRLLGAARPPSDAPRPARAVSARASLPESNTQ